MRAQAQAKGLAWAVDRATAGKGALLTAAGLYAALAMAAGSADLANGQEVFDGNCACGPAQNGPFYTPAHRSTANTRALRRCYLELCIPLTASALLEVCMPLAAKG